MFRRLKLVKPNPRTPRQAEAYRRGVAAHLAYLEAENTKNLKTMEWYRKELESPAEHDHYCDDCGSGHSSCFNASACCSEHP